MVIPFISEIEMLWPHSIQVSFGEIDTARQQNNGIGCECFAQMLNERLRIANDVLQPFYPEVKVGDFTALCNRKTGESRLMFQAEAVPWTDMTMAKAEKLVVLIEKVTTEKSLEQANYIMTETQFQNLSNRIEDLGGTIRDERPYFQVKLPKKKQLGQKEYLVLANRVELMKLTAKLTKLEERFHRHRETESSSS